MGKTYSLARYTGQTVKVRLRATSSSYNDTIANFDPVVIPRP